MVEDLRMVDFFGEGSRMLLVFGWELPCHSLEELDEVRWVFEAEVVADFLARHVGVVQESLGLEYEAVVDEGEWCLASALYDAVGECLGGDVELVGVVLDGVHGGVSLLHHLAEHDEEAVGGFLLVELVVDGLKAITVDVDDEYLGEGEHHVGMSEGLGFFLFFEHSAHDDVEDVGCRFVDGEAGFAVVGVEHAIFDEHVFCPVAPADDVGAEAEDYTFAAHGIVKEMYLSWGDKQECVLFHLILVKVQGVCASCFPEP